MKCIHCESEWNISAKASISYTKCPFCGEDPQEPKERKFFETSREALAAIYKQFGADILLGKLNAYFPDVAPSVSANIKGLVYAVYEKGASKVLKENINASKENKESAVKIAVRNLTEAFILPEMAENIICEFADALGWQIDKSANAASQSYNQHDPKTASAQKAPPQTTQQTLSLKPDSSITKIGDVIPFGGFNWLVLDVKRYNALIISENIIEMRKYDSEAVWESSFLRKYLNSIFISKFFEGDSKRIIQTRNVNNKNLWYDISGGKETTDSVFLLSIEEAEKYFGSCSDYQNKNRSNSIGKEDSNGHFISNKHDSKRIAKYNNVKQGWWLRSPGISGYNTASVSDDGKISVSGIHVYSANGVRPALWLML